MAGRDPYEVFPHQLPVDGSDDSAFLSMGIEFGPFEEKATYRGSRLPEGWAIFKEHLKKKLIRDDNGNDRAYILLGERPLIRPLRRFDHGRDTYAPDQNTSARFCVWDYAIKGSRDDQVVFEKTLGLPDFKVNKDAHHGRLTSYIKTSFCERWLAVNYPNWEDNNAYWNEEEKKEEK